MTLSGLLPLLTRNSQLGELIDALRLGMGREAIVAPDPATAYLVAAIWCEFGAPVVVVTPNPEAARRLTDQMGVWQAGAPLFQFAETENIPFEHYVPDILSTHQRLQTLAALIEPPAGRPPIVVASIQAVAQSTIDRATFDQAAGAICAGDSVSPAELVRRWTDIGYRIEPTVEVPGSASRRGGILDVFPVTSPQPARMDFFGDEVESIRLFDPYTQRSTGTVESITIPPARETLPSIANEERVQDRLSKLNLDWCNPELQQRIPAELGQALRGELTDRLSYYSGFFNGGSLFDYMPDDSLLVVLRPTGVEEAARTTDARLSALRERKERRGEAPRRFPLPHIEWGFLADAMSGRSRRLDISPWGAGSPVLQSEDQANAMSSQSRRLDISPLGAGSPVLQSEDREEWEEPSHSPSQDAHALIDDVTRLPLEPAPLAGRSIERALELAGHGSNSGRRYVFMTNHALRVADVANERGLNARVETALDETPAEGTVRIVQGHLRQGFTLGGKPGDGFTLLTDHEIFGVTKERRRVRRRHVRRGPLLEQLKPGSFVVHVEHGVAKFTGTHVMDSRDGREFLVLEYADGDKLYVPTDHLDRIQFYHGSGDAQPRLTRLGTQEWSRAKARARRATEQLAGELMALYAARSVVAGFQSEADTPWQDALEASFPYEETPDQLTTIDAVKEDLLAPQPMDRLVCGDVGYGKTEVALRAAFKVVQSGRQVAILVPTTVLAQQHFATFTERLAPYPVRVEMLSRFRSPSNQKSVVAGLASGQVDICIGTHRILQRDVSVKNLGLAVIDEEHKFGVTHKERLKQLRTQVDVLTLSATPIPRTLHMALAGVRDMSTIDTPPEERLPIKTYVSEENDELVREAILRELDRGGQVFYLHNRVRTIDRVAAHVHRLVPEARIGIGHGQMPEDELEQVMSDFSEREFDVLVCTTIIESGIDLPNVNTLVIDRADMFGLSQLYQVRGRIGRGTNRAYAYLMVPRGRQLSETAEQRLNTILAATELGAGFQIAMRDLEIRGMGNILGAEQSGHIAAVGFDLYSKLLADTVRDLKSGADPTRSDPVEFSTVRVDLGLDARIPDSFIEDLAQRLIVYQRLARMHSSNEIDDLREELWDRFGPVPRNVDLLLDAARMRTLAEQSGIDSVVAKEDTLTLTLKEATGGARQALQSALGRGVRVGHMQIRVDIDRDADDWLEESLAVMEQVKLFRDRLLSMSMSA